MAAASSPALATEPKTQARIARMEQRNFTYGAVLVGKMRQTSASGKMQDSVNGDTFATRHQGREILAEEDAAACFSNNALRTRQRRIRGTMRSGRCSLRIERCGDLAAQRGRGTIHSQRAPYRPRQRAARPTRASFQPGWRCCVPRRGGRICVCDWFFRWRLAMQGGQTVATSPSASTSIPSPLRQQS